MLQHSRRWFDARAAESAPLVFQRLQDLAREVAAGLEADPDWNPIDFMYRELVWTGNVTSVLFV